MEVIIRPTAAAAANCVARIIAAEVSRRPNLVLGLATGGTMEGVYAGLAHLHRQQGLDFSRCQTFNLDEYVGVPADDPHSYRAYMRRHFFDKVNIPLDHTHLPDGMAANLETECANYETLIARSGGIDLQILGIGLTGHVGFNEPPASFRSRTHVETLSPVTRRQNAPRFPSPELVPSRAITVGIGTILDARRCVLLATGREKAGIVAKAIQGPLTDVVAASALQLHPNCAVILDEAAGASLSDSGRFRMDTSPSLVPISDSDHCGSTTQIP